MTGLGRLVTLGCALAQVAVGAGDALLSFPLTDLESRPVALGQLAGAPAVVNFWARWCVPCREELPSLEQLRRGHPRARVLGVALDDAAGPVREFTTAYGLGFPSWLASARGDELLELAGDEGAALPYTIAFDAQGRIVYRHRGIVDPAAMEALYTRLWPGSP